MNQKQIEKIVEKYIDGKLKKLTEEKNTYKKVENLLKYYNRFIRRIDLIEANLDNIVLKKSTGFTDIPKTNNAFKTEMEKKEEIKESLLRRLEKYKILVQLVETAMEEIKDDKYFKIIELRYFDKKNIEEIAEELGIGVTSVKRHRNRLVTDLCEIIFPEETLEKIF